MTLARVAEDLIARAEALEQGHGTDAAAVAAERELRDRETLAGCAEAMIARRDALADRHRYLACVTALGTRPISLLASSLRGELVTPELRSRIEREIASLGLDHVPLRFTEQSESGKSFFEMALDSAGRAKKSTVLSEGEQRALAIACFLADAHVSESRGAIIVDDPVTSLDHQRIRRVANRFVAEASRGRQIIIFTHNLLFYQEILRACAERDPQVPALPCLIQQSASGFGLVSVDDQPWIAKKVKERERAVVAQLKGIPDGLAPDSDELRLLAKQFYTDLRETWERAVEEVVLGGVVERFGTDVKTQSLKLVDIGDADYRTIFFAMKRASERSGHDQAAAKQIDAPDKKQMEADLLELRGFIAAHKKKAQAAGERRKEMEQPPKAVIA
jgi:energy-coupling factor transporter ATP-binding protein EcfA2